MRLTPFAALLFAAVLLGGCYEAHERPPLEGPDAGVSRFEGRWLVDHPTRALYDATIYDLRPDGRFVEECSFSFDGRVPVGVVQRDADGLRCEMTGPWSSRVEGELAVDCFGDDGVARTVVLAVTWGDEAPVDVAIDKVDGEETGWTHPGFDWRWLPCASDPTACAEACAGP